MTHQTDSVHVDTRLGRGDIDGGADQLCFGERLRNDGNEIPVTLGHAFVYQRGKTADEVDAYRVRRPLEGMRHPQASVRVHPACDQRDRRDGHALVDNRYAVFLFNVATGLHQMLRGVRNLVIDLITQSPGIVADTVVQRDAHGYGAYIQILLPDHLDCFQYVFGFQHQTSPPVQIWCIA